jgi:hypothetical protein
VIKARSALEGVQQQLNAPLEQIEALQAQLAVR